MKTTKIYCRPFCKSTTSI
ncbi:hypothetical protein IPU53_23655 [Bacillus sp. SD088]|nr:hypothetical protein [Bacillus sp. SD088]